MGLLTVFFLSLVLGCLLELAYAFFHEKFLGKPFRINHRLTLGKKISVLSLPFWGILGLIITQQGDLINYITLFLISAILGTLLEYGLGKFMLEAFGIRFWTYKYGSIGKFTSIYSIPYWGAVGFFFGFLMKLIGI